MTQKFRTLNEANLSGKRVVVRLDLNVPMRKGVVSDFTRMELSAATLNHLQAQGAKVFILSHFGRPDGKIVPDLSLRQIVAPLSQILDQPIIFSPTVWHDELPEAFFSSEESGGFFLLENTRFHPGEESNDPLLARKMASLGDIYVNDAFSVSHRAHASTEGITHFLPAFAGFAMEKELNSLGSILSSPKRPFFGIIGGSKISTKIALLDHLTTKMDALLIGGGMANSFLAAQGVNIGTSLCEPACFDKATALLRKAKENECRIILPIDAQVAKKTSKSYSDHRMVDLSHIDSTDMILDIGHKSVNLFVSSLSKARTIIWNGPLGAFETPPFDHGTISVASEVARLTCYYHLLSVAGGGDTMAALRQARIEGLFSYISTGGGAFLEWLEGKDLPGVTALSKTSIL